MPRRLRRPANNWKQQCGNRCPAGTEVADGLRRCSDSLANKPLEEVLEDVRSYGRQYPAAVIGGSVLAGLMLGKLSQRGDARQG